MKFLATLIPANAHYIRVQIEEKQAQWENRWFALLKPFIWLASYFTFYTFEEGSFHFRRLPISGQFVYWGQKTKTRRGIAHRGWQRPSLRCTVYGGDSNLDLQFSFCFFLIGIYLTLERILPPKYQFQYQSKNYGSLPCERSFSFYYHENAIWLQLWDNEDDYNAKQTWINKMHVFHFPWDWDWVRTSELLEDGTWFNETYNNRMSWKEKDEIKNQLKFWRKKVPYRYQMRSGEIQNVDATIGVEEREWRWRWFKWLPLFKRIKKSISVEFSSEVGEETGSWKGGTLGCGYTLLPNEDPVDCLRRMEKERKF